MTYVASAVFAVPTHNKDEYIKHSSQMAELFKQNGATRVVDCWGENVPDGEITSFPMAVQCKPDETVCFSWIEWPSKEVHDEAMPKTMEAMRSLDMGAMPFDGKRMIFGEFEIVMEK